MRGRDHPPVLPPGRNLAVLHLCQNLKKNRTSNKRKRLAVRRETRHENSEREASVQWMSEIAYVRELCNLWCSSHVRLAFVLILLEVDLLGVRLGAGGFDVVNVG